MKFLPAKPLGILALVMLALIVYDKWGKDLLSGSEG